MKREAPQPNKENCSQSELETAMLAAASGRNRDRMRAILSLMTDVPEESLLSVFRICERTLRNWVERFNESGIDGLIDKPRSGRPRAIPAEKTEQCEEPVREPSKAGQVHWTARKYHGYLREELKLEVAYSTTVRWLHERGFRLKIPRPWPDRQNEAERQAFVERIAEFLKDEKIEIWFNDETGIEGDPRPRGRWAKKGEKTRVTRNGEHIRENVVGLVCPRTGEFFAVELPCVDGEVFQEFLRQANACVSLERPRNLLAMDNASWHKGKGLEWGAFEPIYLPAYSPDLNPIERLWQVIKATWFADFVAKDRAALSDRVDQALRWAFDRKAENKITCAIKSSL